MAFETTLEVRFGDVDRAGIAYYPVILHYCHVAFEDFFAGALETPYPDVIEKRRLGLPTVKLDTTFESPFRYGAKVTVQISLTKVGNSSARWRFRFLDVETGNLLAVSENTTVAVDMDSFQTVPIPDDLRTLFQKHLAD